MGRLGSCTCVYFVMGICGSGKSTIALALAQRMGITMLDADDFHPQENVQKMAAGIPLNDADRAGWLQTLNGELRQRQGKGESVVLACSALKQVYRDTLQTGLEASRWIYLRGDRETILSRVAQRSNHFMPSSLVDSQLETLEEPTDAIELDIKLSIEAIVAEALRELKQG